MAGRNATLFTVEIIFMVTFQHKGVDFGGQHLEDLTLR